MNGSKLGFGILGSLDLALVEEIAKRVEAAGLASLWINDTPGGDSLARIEMAAAVTSRITLATGVIAVDRVAPAEIIHQVGTRNLPQERLIIGIGSSAKPNPLTRVRSALDTLREEFDFPIVVGSLGPRMRQLGAESGDGLLFNWLPPRFARETTRELKRQCLAEGRSEGIAATYVRTGLGEASRTALEDEAARYFAIPSYAANFARLGITAMDSVVWGTTPEAIQQGLGAYDGAVDHVILRAITPSHDLEHYVALIEAAAPLA